MVYGTQHRRRRRYRGRKSRAGAKHKQRNFAAIMRICAARRRQLNGALGVVGTVEYAVVSDGGYGMVRRREAGGGGGVRDHTTRRLAQAKRSAVVPKGGWAWYCMVSCHTRGTAVTV